MLGCMGCCATDVADRASLTWSVPNPLSQTHDGEEEKTGEGTELMSFTSEFDGTSPSISQSLVDAAIRVNKDSKYSNKSLALMKRLQGPNSAVIIRVERHVIDHQQQDSSEGLESEESKAAVLTIDKFLDAASRLASQPSTLPAAITVLSLVQNLVYLIGEASFR